MSIFWICCRWDFLLGVRCSSRKGYSVCRSTRVVQNRQIRLPSSPVLHMQTIQLFFFFDNGTTVHIYIFLFFSRWYGRRAGCPWTVWRCWRWSLSDFILVSKASLILMPADHCIPILPFAPPPFHSTAVSRNGVMCPSSSAYYRPIDFPCVTVLGLGIGPLLFMWFKSHASPCLEVLSIVFTPSGRTVCGGAIAIKWVLLCEMEKQALPSKEKHKTALWLK